MGRCNTEGSPVLYVSEELNTPFEELNIAFNKQFYAITYKTKERLNLNNIVPKEFESKDIDGNLIYDNESMLSYQILREFVRSEFLKPVGKGTEYLHRISASMCRVWFHNVKSDGWTYPSVQSPLEKNIALKPESAQNKLEILDIRIARLVPKDNVKNHKEKFVKHPFYHAARTVIETDFIGKIEDKKINWAPANDLGWTY